MEIRLMFAPGSSYVVEVDQKEVLDAGIIKYKDEYYVFDSKRSKAFSPVFVKAEIFEVK